MNGSHARSRRCVAVIHWGKRHIFEKICPIIVLADTADNFFRLQKNKRFSHKIFPKHFLKQLEKNGKMLKFGKKLLISCKRFSRKCGPEPTKTGRNRPKPYETITKPSRNRRKSHECMQTMPRNQFCALAGI